MKAAYDAVRRYAKPWSKEPDVHAASRTLFAVLSFSPGEPLSVFDLEHEIVPGSMAGRRPCRWRTSGLWGPAAHAVLALGRAGSIKFQG